MLCIADAFVAANIGKALTWHALGCYHLLLNRHDQAWRLFHKAAQQVLLLTTYYFILLHSTMTVDVTAAAVVALVTSATALPATAYW
jgi:hypothetical protein